jgi:lysine-N-methylase
MPLPVRHLPVVQNWDCQGCSNCCREYQIPVTEEERTRILALDWGNETVPADPFTTEGSRGAGQHVLRHQNGGCVFLSPEGRCRIHARFGAEAKPFACRLYPFVLVPTNDHWRVSLRFNCPSAAASAGRPLAEHEGDVEHFARLLEKQEGIEPGRTPPPPPLQAGQRVDWRDLLRFGQTLLTLVRHRADRVHVRLRKGLALARLCRQARFDKISGKRLGEFLNLVSDTLGTEVPADPASVPPPGWIGRILFRPILAIYLRQDHGPGQGTAQRTPVGRLQAGWRFARGRGSVPRVHAFLPETTFECLEEPAGPLPEAAEQVLERYYTVKVGSFQFCGATNFGLPFWDGFESLVLTYPAILWLSRAFTDLPRHEAVARAVGIVDNHFGHNRLLGTQRHRVMLRILARRGELDKLVAWYSR